MHTDSEITTQPKSTYSIRTRILFSFLIVLVFVIALVSVTTLRASLEQVNAQLESRLQTATAVFQLMVQNEASRLENSLVTFSKDFSAKQLLADVKNDPQSLQVALFNLQQRTGSNFIAAFSNDGRVLAGNQPHSLSALPVHLKNGKYDFLELEHEIYLVKAVPYRFLEKSPRPDGWLLMGNSVEQVLQSEEAQELVGLDLTAVNGQLAVTSTKPDMIEALNQHALAKLPYYALHEVHLDSAHLLWRFQLHDERQTKVYFIYSIPKEQAYLNFSTLSDAFILIVLVASGLALLVSFYLSNGVSKPLKTLAGIAQKIQKGDYQCHLPQFRTTEVASLSQALSSMQQGINQREAEIHKLAYFDSLTELPNRNAFVRQLEQELKQNPQQKFAVMAFDLDSFKEINDTLGHAVGDKLLKRVAERLQSYQHLAGFQSHIGEDEFIVMLAYNESYQLKSDIEQYIHLFDSAFDIDGVLIDMKAGFGVALYPEHADSSGGLMQSVDIALGKSKGSHLSVVYYDPAQNPHTIQRLSLMTELRLAIESEQLQLYYQPKLDLKLGRVTKVECLVRWIHPEHGFVGPDEFIPLAEKSGAIRDLTKWAIRTALKQHLKWSQYGIDLTFAVNISALDLVDNSLPVFVSETLYELGLPASVLTFEVTESAIMSEPEQAMMALDMLKKMGVSLSIDDFGTGYSSMGQLKQMPVCELKIDKSFVLNLASDASDEVIVKSTVELAHNLGLQVVAEGIEDETSLAILKKHQVEFGQGYFIARPMKADDFVSWFQDSQYGMASLQTT